MNKVVLITTLFVSSAIGSEETCLEQSLLKQQVRSVTGTGLTIEEARMDLYKKLPEVGVLETVKLDTTKRSTLESFHESNHLSKSIRASFDHVMIKNCRLADGRFGASAAFPIDGVSYLPKHEGTGIFEEPIWDKKFATFKYANQSCGNEIYTVLIGLNPNYSLEGGRIIHQDDVKGIQRVIICGSFKLKTQWFNQVWTTDIREIFAEKYNMVYFGSYRTKYIKDYSRELGLELIKNSL